jgi:hypothetical protein
MSWLEPLKNIFGRGPEVLPVTGRVTTRSVTGVATATVKAGTPVNTPIPVNIVYDPLKPAVSTIQPAPDETWVIEDIFVTSAPSIDGVVQFVIDDSKDVQKTNPLSTYRADYANKPRIDPVTVPGMHRLNLYFYNSTAGGSNDVTVTFYLKIRIIKYE